MSTQTVFQEGHQPNEEIKQGEPNQQTPDAFADQLAQILNEEGKPKYKDVQTALAALKASQEYIPAIKQEKEQLEQRINELQQELSKRAVLQEVVEKLKQEKHQPTQEQPTMEEQQTQAQALTPEQVQQMLEQYVPQILEKRQEQTVAQQNILAVDQKLKEFYGEKVEEAVKTKAESLGLSIQDLEALSAKSPASVLALLGVKETKPTGKTFQSSVAIPPVNPANDDLKPEKSMLLGATGKEQAEYLRRLREDVLRKHGYNS